MQVDRRSRCAVLTREVAAGARYIASKKDLYILYTTTPTQTPSEDKESFYTCRS